MGRRAREIEADCRRLHAKAWWWCNDRRKVLKEAPHFLGPDDALEQAWKDTLANYKSTAQQSAVEFTALPTEEPTGDAFTGPLPSTPSGGRTLWPLSAFKSLHASKRDNMDWVANMMDIDELQPIDAPSPAAWSWLLECRSSPSARRDFYNRYQDDRRKNDGSLGFDQDDDSDGIELNDRIFRALEAAALPSGSEGDYGESLGPVADST